MYDSVRDSNQLQERLVELGENLAFDVRSQRVLRSGKPLGDRDLDVIIDRSRLEEGPVIPSMRTDVGRTAWNAWGYHRGVDPLVEYFDEVVSAEPWDPGFLAEALWTDRLSRVDRDLIRWCWRAFFRAVVARAYDPPVRWDIVPILAGEQGSGKSTYATNLLPSRWTNGGFPLRGVSDFDGARKTTEFTEGKAILESSEMVGMKADNREAVKSFLSQDTDRSARKYAVQAEDVPRRWVIIGTTNDRLPIPYDPSGGRRWIVTRIKGMLPDDGKRIYEELVATRHHYWSFAVRDYRAKGARLSVPSYLGDLHSSHVEANMWRPPSQMELF